MKNQWKSIGIQWKSMEINENPMQTISISIVNQWGINGNHEIRGTRGFLLFGNHCDLILTKSLIGNIQYGNPPKMISFGNRAELIIGGIYFETDCRKHVFAWNIVPL